MYKKLGVSRTAMMLAISFMLSACSTDHTPSTDITAPGTETSTWHQVQQILATNCTSCHAAGTSQARQSGLILTPDLAYTQLVDQAPKNLAAQSDGLMRVASGGPAGLAKSFLWEKINAPNEDHFTNGHPQYGRLMPPPQMPPLSYGQLEFIRQWIFAGAPETGAVVNPSLLENEDRYVYSAEAFVAPIPPVHGTQLHLGPFEVYPHNEREFFYYQALNNPTAVYIERVEIAMRPGSHHFILYGFDAETPTAAYPDHDIIRDLRDRQGLPITRNYLPMAFHQFITGTQWPLMDMSLPDGVALAIPANYAFDMNSHYVNRTDNTSTGEVYINLHYAEPNRIDHVAKVIDFNNSNIVLPAGTETTLERVFKFNERAHVFQLFSHAHELNREFRVELVGGQQDGRQIYFSNDWEHPPIVEYDPPLQLERGEGLRLTATYNNTRDHEVNFGLLSTDEMMILFGLYYTD